MYAYLVTSFKKFKAVYLATAFGLFVCCLLYVSYRTMAGSDVATQLLSLIPDGPIGIATLFVLLSLGMAIGLPRQVAAFCAGFVLDITFGALFATFAAAIGCCISYLVSRQLLSSWVINKYPSTTKKITAFLSHQTFTKSLIIRFIPAGSNFLTNVIAGATRIPFKPFILGSALGYIPQMVIFTMIGNGIKIGSEQQLTLSALLFVLAGLLSYALYQENKRKLEE